MPRAKTDDGPQHGTRTGTDGTAGGGKSLGGRTRTGNSPAKSTSTKKKKKERKPRAFLTKDQQARRW